jgi:arylsulfatase A-like enzyme
LTEHGVRFVEVSHNLNFVNGTGWDTHKEGQQNQWTLIEELDQATAALIDDLEARGRLDKTLIVIATEFGRPPEFDGAGGRGHQSKAFTLVLAGEGLSHRGALGTTDELSKSIVERPVSIPDFHATIHHALGIDFRVELYDGNRPVPITDNGTPVAELFAG